MKRIQKLNVSLVTVVGMLMVFSSGSAWAQAATDVVCTGCVASTDLADGGVANVDVSATAAIAGTKVVPNFGAQNIITTGRVGVGTTNPLSVLNISNPNTTIFRVDQTANGYASQIRVDQGGVYWEYGTTATPSAFFTLSAAGGTNNISTKGRNFRIFSTADPVGFIYLTNGNVGIGTTNPGAYKLAVKGKIRAEEVVVETGWADYVFHKDYKLMSLHEVEKNIQEKGHLPGIPSAQEVKEQGVNIGQMQSKLLEKIEEMTLYVIELKKENDTLKERISSLEMNRN